MAMGCEQLGYRVRTPSHIGSLMLAMTLAADTSGLFRLVSMQASLLIPIIVGFNARNTQYYSRWIFDGDMNLTYDQYVYVYITYCNYYILLHNLLPLRLDMKSGEK